MPTILHALADAYRTSAAGRRGGARDFTIDYEKLLRIAGLADGSARELAERDLAHAAQGSEGSLCIERHPRSGIPQLVRLSREGGEAWLFHALGLPSPAASRQELASFFRSAEALPIPLAWEGDWRKWFADLAEAALSGGSVQPFSRENPSASQALLHALHGVITWPHESLIRYASVRITGDSKALESLRPRVVQALRAITGDPEAGYETFGILDTPRAVLVHGPLGLVFPEATLDLGLCHGPVAISSEDLARATPTTSARMCLTVENEGVFREIARRRPGVLLIHTSYPGAATRVLLEKLPRALACHHFGDTDPAGFDILRDLRERTGRPFEPFLMTPGRGGEAYSTAERKTLERLVASPAMHDLHPVLCGMLEAGTKGAFEQEGLDLDRVMEELAGCLSVASPGPR